MGLGVEWNDSEYNARKTYTLLHLMVKNEGTSFARTSPCKVRRVEDPVLMASPVRFALRAASSEGGRRPSGVRQWLI